MQATLFCGDQVQQIYPESIDAGESILREVLVPEYIACGDKDARHPNYLVFKQVTDESLTPVAIGLELEARYTLRRLVAMKLSEGYRKRKITHGLAKATGLKVDFVHIHLTDIDEPYVH